MVLDLRRRKIRCHNKVRYNRNSFYSKGLKIDPNIIIIIGILKIENKKSSGFPVTELKKMFTA